MEFRYLKKWQCSSSSWPLLYLPVLERRPFIEHPQWIFTWGFSCIWIFGEDAFSWVFVERTQDHVKSLQSFCCEVNWLKPSCFQKALSHEVAFYWVTIRMTSVGRKSQWAFWSSLMTKWDKERSAVEMRAWGISSSPVSLGKEGQEKLPVFS